MAAVPLARAVSLWILHASLCGGLGLIQALYCDVRFVSGSAKLTTAFARRGLVAEHGLSWLLPRLVGPARALDLLLSARVICGEEAVELGLAARAVCAEGLHRAQTAKKGF